MLSRIDKIYTSVLDKAFPLIDLLFKYQKPISYFTFLAALHPSYKQFNLMVKSQENQIKNYSTKNDSKVLYESLSNIKYEILFDFLDIHQLKKIPLEISGYIKIIFDFDKEKFPENDNFLKIDYQGKVSEIYINNLPLNKEKDYYIEQKAKKDNFEQQEKNCIFIDKIKLLKNDNEILLKFKKIFDEENFNSINNPFLKLEDIHMNDSRSIYVIN